MDDPDTPSVAIPTTYQGFPYLALGGYTAGLLMEQVGSSAEIRLQKPVPLETTLDIRVDGDGAELIHDGDVLTEARPADLSLDLPEPAKEVDLADAKAASKRYPGFRRHAFPKCFTCGPDRDVGDGLRIFPGPLKEMEEVGRPPGTERSAADRWPVLAGTWTPHDHHADEEGLAPPTIVGSAVDCPGISAHGMATPRDSQERFVSGGFTIRQTGDVVAGRPHVVLAWPEPQDGRRLPAGTVILTEDGDVVVEAVHTLVLSDWGGPLGFDALPEYEGAGGST